MIATLYPPSQEPLIVNPEGLYLPDIQTGLVPYSSRAASLLGCAPQLVDILACGPDFVVYSIFDYEGAANVKAMAALSRIIGHQFDISDDEQIIRGPVLLIQEN